MHLKRIKTYFNALKNDRFLKLNQKTYERILMR